mgnify:CR=1 FL=1
MRAKRETKKNDSAPVLRIRRAKPSDFETIIPMAFALQAYEASVEEAVQITEKTKKDLEKFIRKNLKRKDARFFIAYLGKDPVGYVSGWLSKSNITATGKAYGFICDLFVLEPYQRQGVGKELVAELMRWFDGNGVEYIEAYTYVTNPPGRRFWEKEGFGENMIRYLMKRTKE